MLNRRTASPEGQIFVGVAGWNYPEWRGLLENEGAERSRSELFHLATWFNLVEINSTYYHPSETKTVKAWLAEIGEGRGFLFTARLWNKFVRERALLLQNDIRLMKAALAPLQEAGKLGAVLVQVMPSMRYSESNELWLLGLVNLFAEFPLFVENLHGSWAKSDTLLRLQDRGVGLVATFQAEAPATFSKITAQRTMYLRCRGRHENAHLTSPGATPADLYSSAEISSLARMLKNMLPELAQAFVVFNNSAQGRSLANAVQLRHALTGDLMDLPRNFVQAFPALNRIASVSAQQCDLFEESV